MPAQACSAPTGDGSPNNKLSGLSADGFSLTPSFSKDTTSYNLIVDTSVTSLQISATAADGKASVAGTGNTELTGNSSDITITVTAQNGSTRTYSIHVVRQSGGNTPSGTDQQILQTAVPLPVRQVRAEAVEDQVTREAARHLEAAM